jgi:hypothetical protein
MGDKSVARMQAQRANIRGVCNVPPDFASLIQAT